MTPPISSRDFRSCEGAIRTTVFAGRDFLSYTSSPQSPVGARSRPSIGKIATSEDKSSNGGSQHPSPEPQKIEDDDRAEKPDKQFELARIVRDEGPATSGGASKTRQVVIERPDGSQAHVHAKFAKTTTGTDAAENGARGLASELLAGLLASAMGANVPSPEVVVLPEDVDITLQDGTKPEPGIAFVSHTIDSSIDVPNADAIQDVPTEQIARISALESWTEMADRGHNMIKSNRAAYSIDHASGFASTWSGNARPASLVENAITKDRLGADSSSMKAAAASLEGVSDEVIDAAVESVPDEWMSTDERARFKADLKSSHDVVAQQIRGATGP